MVSQFKYSSALDFGLVVKFQMILQVGRRITRGKGEDATGSGRKDIHTLSLVIKKY